jgi:hypothetical protein
MENTINGESEIQTFTDEFKKVFAAKRSTKEYVPNPWWSKKFNKAAAIYFTIINSIYLYMGASVC